MNVAQQDLYYLGVALAVGLLIGIERGWHERMAKEGERIAGVRTYGLIGLLGGSSALLAQHFGNLNPGLLFIALAGVLTAVYIANLGRRADMGITSLITGLLAFVFGALAGSGEVVLASSAAVVTTLLLGYKPVLHRWISALEGEELRAGLKLLLISVVLLPILPNRGYGPWQALNPYAIWWMVVLIATISFVGYFAVKIGGTRKGAVFTGLFGGLASSTATTLHFSRLSRESPGMASAQASGILLACGTMFPRMLLVASVVNPQLLFILLPPVIIMTVIVYAPVILYWRQSRREKIQEEAPLTNPLELKQALGFGMVLAFIMLLGTALKNRFGDTGLMMLAVASGLADVDAITLSLSRMSTIDLGIPVTVMGIVIAAAVNSIVKAVIAVIIGSAGIGIRAAVPLLASAAAGMLTAWLALQYWS